MTDRELLNCLTDRPCDVCKFRGENGCSQWTCVFCDGLFGDMRTKQEPSGDLISRQTVLDGIEELKKSPWATDKRGNGFEYLIAEALDVVADLCVKQAPSVNPQEPKTGHWIEHEKGFWSWVNKNGERDGWIPDYECSECGSRAWKRETNYCPQCGAKMVEPQESEDKE